MLSGLLCRKKPGFGFLTERVLMPPDQIDFWSAIFWSGAASFGLGVALGWSLRWTRP